MMYINGQAVAPTNLVKEGHNYSTDEQVIGTWINGKPLYEKTFSWGELNLSSLLTQKEHNIANVDKGFVVSAWGYRQLDGFWKNVIGNTVGTFTDDTNIVRGIVWGMDSTYLKFRTNGTTGLVCDECYVVMQYTKTTD